MADGLPRIPANDFTRQWQDIRDDAIDAVDRVGRSGWLILGDEVSAFEKELADWWGIPHAVGVASGLDALEIALRCAGVQAGTRVITTPLTAFATTLAIIRAGAEPVWSDVDESGGLDLDQLDAALRTDASIRAVLPVHLYGHPMDPSALEQLTTEHGVAVIEDCAQSLGAERDGQPTGIAAIAAGTSLYPTKNLGAMGDGGVLLTRDADLANQARALRDYGQTARYEHVKVGLNSRLDEVHAAILRSALMPRLEGWLARRTEIASRYTEALRDSGLRPIAASGGHSAHHLFPVELINGQIEAFVERLAQRGVTVGRHYPFLCPDQPATQGIGTTMGPLPIARRLAARELLVAYPSLPRRPRDRDRDRSLPGRVRVSDPVNSLVVPVYNNASTIVALIEAIELIASRVEGGLEAVFVLDGSLDDSRERLLNALKTSPTDARVVEHSRNFGALAAVRTGMIHARGQRIAVMAADLQEPPELVIEFFTRLASGEVDVLAGERTSRDDRGDTASKLYWRLYRRFVIRDIPPGGVDVFACTAAVRDVVCSLEDINTSLVAQLFWVGFRRELIPYDRLPRPGASGWTLRRKFRYLSDSVFAFTDLPVKILWVVGSIGMTLGLVVGAIVLVARATGTITVPGYAATVLILLFFLSLNSVGLGIIGSYVWRAYETVQGRPGAIVQDVIELHGDKADA